MAWTRISHDLSSCDVGPECGASAAYRWVETYEMTPRMEDGLVVVPTKKFTWDRCEAHAQAALCQFGECEHGACVVDRGMGSRGA